ncbi:cadherin domain-containing protein [Arenibacter sp. GZD96]|uniref:cadherin domain-containing protein n=1 Tax=Aurantibrevibacter litoralis TaxID=3106030 RepID=UPI002AFEFE5B|nr:cadherin domain-containing protein [Arenibacter sp. GZD-96]MEA1784999.1 cadherin domain-containing protein [Arenibacter sp. GZD-96]
MKKSVLTILSFLILSCSTDADNTTPDFENVTNSAPVITVKTISVAEHLPPGAAIGSIDASDADNDEITFSVTSEEDLIINEQTGELTVGANLKLDFETTQSIAFTVAVFDGETIVEQDFTLHVEDLDERILLNEEQNALLSYFQFLAFWKGDNNIPVTRNQKWESPMTLYLEGSISAEFTATVEGVLAQYNEIMSNGDFNISLVQEVSAANARLFFGSKADLEGVWPDMFEQVKDGNFDGFAITPSQNSVLVGTRIWISNPAEVLLKHELGHSLGFGHSNKCETENSFLCSQIQLTNDFLAIEEAIIRLMYDDKLAPGLTELDFEKAVANLLMNAL